MILIIKRFRGGAIRAFIWVGGQSGDIFRGGGQLKNTLFKCCMDAVLSHVIMRMTWGGLLV